MIVHYYNNSIFVIFFIYSILGKRFLLSTVLVVFSTDTEMLFSVAGFQTFQPYIYIYIYTYIKHFKCRYSYIYAHAGFGTWSFKGTRGLGGVNLYWFLKTKETESER